ncbi:MAG: hypothetical protein HY904_23855 [Deltaproteobacteria bacterium]|nr:hypothetical protein [Deltaproteobacteria bacterium]
MDFTRVTRFQQSVPGGWDAYPDYQQKASIYREFLARVDLAPHAAALPPPLRRLVEEPVPVSSWIPEAHSCGLFLAMADVLGSDAAFVTHSYESNRALLSGPAYGFLFKLLGARTVLKGARTRWGQLHRGITMDVTWGDTRNEASLIMHFPEHLLPPLLLRSYATAFRAALEVAGASAVEVRVGDAAATSAQFHAAWK